MMSFKNFIQYLLNPTGGVISQFILSTTGYISSDYKQKYRQNAHFLETLSGWFDQDSMAFIMDRVKGYYIIFLLMCPTLCVIKIQI